MDFYLLNKPKEKAKQNNPTTFNIGMAHTSNLCTWGAWGKEDCQEFKKTTWATKWVQEPWSIMYNTIWQIKQYIPKPQFSVPLEFPSMHHTTTMGDKVTLIWPQLWSKYSRRKTLLPFRERHLQYRYRYDGLARTLF